MLTASCVGWALSRGHLNLAALLHKFELKQQAQFDNSLPQHIRQLTNLADLTGAERQRVHMEPTGCFRASSLSQHTEQAAEGLQTPLSGAQG